MYRQLSESNQTFSIYLQYMYEMLVILIESLAVYYKILSTKGFTIGCVVLYDTLYYNPLLTVKAFLLSYQSRIESKN